MTQKKNNTNAGGKLRPIERISSCLAFSDSDDPLSARIISFPTTKPVSLLSPSCIPSADAAGIVAPYSNDPVTDRIGSTGEFSVRPAVVSPFLIREDERPGKNCKGTNNIKATHSNHVNSLPHKKAKVAQKYTTATGISSASAVAYANAIAWSNVNYYCQYNLRCKNNKNNPHVEPPTGAHYITVALPRSLPNDTSIRATGSQHTSWYASSSSSFTLRRNSPPSNPGRSLVPLRSYHGVRLSSSRDAPPAPQCYYNNGDYVNGSYNHSDKVHAALWHYWKAVTDQQKQEQSLAKEDDEYDDEILALMQEEIRWLPDTEKDLDF